MPKSRVQIKKFNSLGMAVFLVVAIVVLWYIVKNIRSSGVPAELAGLINTDYENFRGLQRFEDDAVKEAQEKLAGFWTFAEGDTAASPTAKREYMEIIDNGMIWNVTDWYVNAPSGDRHKITRVWSGYIGPFSRNHDNTAYVSETRVLRQVYITDGDTCYGASQADEIWYADRAGEGGDGRDGGAVLTVNRRDYQKYGGDIKEFFPDGGLLDIVDMIGLRGCAAATDLPFLSQKALARSLDAVPFFARAGVVDSLIRNYYKPLVIDEMVRLYDPRLVSDSFAVQLTISAEGELVDVKHRAKRTAKMLTKRFDDNMALEIRRWLFPAVGDTDEAQRVELTISIK